MASATPSSAFAAWLATITQSATVRTQPSFPKFARILPSPDHTSGCGFIAGSFNCVSAAVTTTNPRGNWKLMHLTARSDVPEKCEQHDAKRRATHHRPQRNVPAVMLRDPAQALGLNDPAHVTEEAHKARRRAHGFLRGQV